MTYSWCGAWCGAEVVDLVGLGAETGRRRARGCALPLSLGVKNSHIHNSHIHNNLHNTSTSTSHIYSLVATGSLVFLLGY
jgi:hypothetical protein